MSLELSYRGVGGFPSAFWTSDSNELTFALLICTASATVPITVLSTCQYGKHTNCDLLDHFYIYFHVTLLFFTISYCSYLSMHAVKKNFLALETFLFENWTFKKNFFHKVELTACYVLTRLICYYVCWNQNCRFV